MMRTRLLLILSMTVIFTSESIGRSDSPRQSSNASAPQTVTLYPPYDKSTGKYDETRSCFSFKLGRKKLPGSSDWDLAYGFAQISDEDWLKVGINTPDRRTVMKELGEYGWSDPFTVPALESLPRLKEGESRQITIDASADTHKDWARSTSIFAKAKRGHIYVMRVKDDQADFYVLFRIEELEQGDHCTISWKRIPPPEVLPAAAATTRDEGIKVGRLLARKVENGVDNYPYAAFSFEFGGNGPDVQKLCRNDWDILFGNSPLPDAFDVTIVGDDRSRIRDLGRFKWDDRYDISRLSAYEEPEREPSVKAVEGHLYLVRVRDRNSDYYALFRVEKLEPGIGVDISWKVIPPPNQRR